MESYVYHHWSVITNFRQTEHRIFSQRERERESILPEELAISDQQSQKE